MAAGDLALRVLLTAETGTFITAFSGVGGMIKNIFSGMGSSIGNLVFGFRNLGTAGTIGMDAIKQGATGLLLGLAQLVAVLAVVAAVAAIGIGVAGVKAAGDFQASMTRLVTSAGELPKNLQLVSAGILQMSVDTATSTDQLAQGMYYVESSSIHGAAALATLGVAARGAKSENADLTTVSKALTTVLIDYHMNVSTAAAATLSSTQAMNGLIAAVQNGKTSLQLLSDSMGQVLPIASALHISFPQVAGALDTMTNAGMSARQAAQNLGHVLLSLSAPSGVAIKSMKQVGLSAQEVKDALVNKGLPQALQLIEDHVGKEFPKGSVQYETALKNILGGIVGFKTAAMLTGDSLKQTQHNIDAITAAMKNGKGGVLGWDAVQQTFNFHMDQAKNAVQALLIAIGTALLPALSRIVGAVAPAIAAFANWVQKSHVVENVVSALGTVFNTVKTIMTPVIGVFMQFMGVLGQVINWVQHNQTAMTAFKYLLIGLGAIIAGVLIVSLIAVAVVIAAVAIVIGVIIGIIMGVIWVVQHWGDIMHWFGGIFSAIGTFIHGVIVNIGNAFSAFGTNVHNIITNIGNGIGNFFSGLGTAVHNGIMAVVNFFVTGFQTIGGWFTWLYNHNYIIQAICDFIRNVFQAVIAWLQNAWQTVVSWLTNIWNTLKTAASIAWGAVSAVVMAVVNAIGSWLHNIWTTTTQWLGNQWNSLKGLATTAWNNVTSVFQNAWNGISGALKGLWNNVSNWFSNLGNQALQWGKNVIQQLINGINSMLGALGNAVANAASKVAGALGFHSPTKEGPGHDSDKWAPAFVNMFASGLIAGIPKITSASYQLSSAMNNALGLGSSNFAVNGGSFALQGKTTVVVQPGQAAPIYLDKRQVGQILFDYQASELRKQGTVRNR